MKELIMLVWLSYFRYGKYQQCDRSGALAGLPMSLLEEALHRLSQETNISVARWFGEAIANLQSREV